MSYTAQSEQQQAQRAVPRLFDPPVALGEPAERLSVGSNGLPLVTRHRDAVLKIYAKQFHDVWLSEPRPLDRGNMDISCYSAVRKIKYLDQQFAVDAEKVYCEPVFNADGVATGVRFMREGDCSYRQWGEVLPVEPGSGGKRKEPETRIVTEMSSGKCQRKVVVTVAPGTLL